MRPCGQKKTIQHFEFPGVILDSNKYFVDIK